VAQDSIQKADLDETFKRFLQGVEGYAPIVLGWLEVARAVEQQLQTFAENAKPYLMALAEIDWTAIARRLNELPKSRKSP
jgi:hypothetical protein